MDASKFSWPKGRRAAVSLSFDDGRSSQLEGGIPLLDSLGVKGTFYLNPPKIQAGQVDGWKRALARGHELGNHTCSHPCSGNFEWSRENAIEDYSLERMETEMLDCNRRMEELFGVRPSTFAYPCGQTYVGRGEGLQSFVPMVARHFAAGRAYLTEYPNDPLYTDLSLLGEVACDDVTFESLRPAVDKAVETGTWLILVGHDMAAKPGFQVTRLGELEKLVRYVQAPERGIWIDTVAAVAQRVIEQRGQGAGHAR